MKTVNIGILGCGIVGTGVAKLLLESADVIRSRLGVELNLKHVADIDTETDRGITFKEGVFINDAKKVITDPDIDIIIETIGGETLAYTFIMESLENGKNVVTANKALLASKGNEIFELAAQKKLDVAFEASVGGCMPVIKTLRENMVGNRIDKISGILNGTCNYILSKITELGSPFKEALADAQAKGFAEADPTLDIDGSDTAHKLAICTALAYGMKINLKDIYKEGISKIDPIDIEFAKQFGYRIKLLAISKANGNSVEARVHPTMIPCESLLSKIDGSLNALKITGDASGDIMLYGHGAGRMPTASAVVSDIVDIARNMMTGSTGRIPLLSYQKEYIKEIPIQPIDEITSQYYFRFMAMDKPGVLSQIAGVLGNNNISILSVIQSGRSRQESVPIVMQIHESKEADVQKAIAQIQSLEVVSTSPVIIRIEDAL